MSNSKEEKSSISRRKFIKGSAVLGTGATIASVSAVTNPKKGTAYAASIIRKELDDFPIEMNSDFKRFHDKDGIFQRASTGLEPKITEDYYGFLQSDPTGEVGHTTLEMALTVGANASETFFGFYSGLAVQSRKGMWSWDLPVNPNKLTFESPKEASKIIKRVMKYYGADLVGIAKYEDVENFVYASWQNPFDLTVKEAEFPFKPKSVIAMAVEMDYESFKCVPSLIQDAATTLGYSNMAEVGLKAATFLTTLGYNAIPCGNDTALSIPIAIQAGLGELARNGLLITEKYGPRVRLLKVFTDLEIAPDKPISFGVHEFCKVCMKCADNCPGDAISKDIEPSYFRPSEIGNIEGVKKWNVNPEKCVHLWKGILSTCGSCQAVCPYNKIDEWHHDLSKLATVIPGVRNLARSFDELFGYGKTFNEQAVNDFWNKEV